MVIEQRIYNYVKSLAPENYSVKRSIIAGNGRRMTGIIRIRSEGMISDRPTGLPPLNMRFAYRGQR